MKSTALLAFLLAALALVAGCSGSPTGAPEAEALAEWLGSQSYSTWFTFSHQDGDPARPASPDGLTLGSPNIFAAIGCKPDDLTSLDVFWADQRTARPLAKPLTMGVRMRGRGIEASPEGAVVPLSSFSKQTLRRIRHTAIAVSESEGSGLRITCVDFAPPDPEQNFLVRWFLAENIGDSGRQVQLVLQMMAPGEWTRLGPHAYQRGESLAVLSDGGLRHRHEELTAPMGYLRPGQRAAVAVLLTAAADPKRLPDYTARAEAALPDLAKLLEETRTEWETWCSRTPLVTGDRRFDDLLDSLLCLVRAHVGPRAIHTGSLRYPHNRAWVRDSYWVQRALLTVGRPEEARLNLDFFHRAWRASGIASYYEIPSYSSTAYGYRGVEVPHYFVLMVRDAEEIAGVDGTIYWDMVQACLDAAAAPPNGLQPMNGDESWLLAAPVRELDALLDNSWLLIASAQYGAELAARVGDTQRAARYQTIAAQARLALRRFTPRMGQAEWYALGRGGDGSLDFSLCPGVLARGALLGAVPHSEPLLAAGLLTSWHRLQFDRGLRAHARSATIDGGTPGYVLYAAADCPNCTFIGELARRVLGFCSATGCVWEFHDLYDPAWGGEKRRLWDSAVLLMGLVHALFDVQVTDGGREFHPKADLPESPPSPAPPFDGEALLSECGPALILHDRAPQHAARLARELLRHRNTEFAVSPYPGRPPDERSAIIISRANPPSDWRRAIRGYWLREWGGPPQLWVRNRDHVFLDTDPLLTDLLSVIAPLREKPLPFPDANLDLAARFGEPASGEAAVSAVSLGRRAAGRLGLGKGRLALKVGQTELSATTRRDDERGTLRLNVSASAPRSDPAELTITVPPGWWVVYARDMTGKWDRVNDPVEQVRLADGRLRLVYSFRAGDRPVHLTFDLARLRVAER